MAPFKIPEPIKIFIRHAIYERILNKSAIKITPKPEFPESLDIQTSTSAELKTLPLSSKGNSFYASLAWYIFKDESYASLISEVLLSHAKAFPMVSRNISSKDNLHLDTTVYEFMEKASHSRQQASFIEVYLAAHFFECQIVLIDPAMNGEDCIIFKPTDVEPNSCIEFEKDRGIILAVEPAQKLNKTIKSFNFRPIISYDRISLWPPKVKRVHRQIGPMILYPAMDLNDLKYHVILADKETKHFVAIPYTVVSECSSKLAEFYGKVLDTNLSVDSLKYVEHYIRNRPRNLTHKLNHQVYEFARLWCIRDLEEQIINYAMQLPLCDVWKFVDNITIFDSMPLLERVREMMYNASSFELCHYLFCNKSKIHQRLMTYSWSIMASKKQLPSLTKEYRLPFVLVCLNSKCAQYFNGDEWFTYFVPDSVKEIAKYLNYNQYAVVNDTLYFIKDDCLLGEVKLINDYKGTVTYTRIQNGKVVQPKLVKVTEGDRLILLSQESNRMCEINLEEKTTTIMPWKVIDSRNIDFTFLDPSCCLYRLAGYNVLINYASPDDWKEKPSLIESKYHQDSTTLEHYRFCVSGVNECFGQEKFENLNTLYIPQTQTHCAECRFMLLSSELFSKFLKKMK